MEKENKEEHHEENKRRSNSYLIPVLMAIAMAVGLLLGNYLSPEEDIQMTAKSKARYQKLQDVLKVLDRKYVDDVNSEELFEQTIADMLHRLDPHSNYIAAKDLKEVNEGIQGKFGGVGVRFAILRDTICITNVLTGSPSMKAGLKSGDKILKVDGAKMTGKTVSNDKVMGVLKGDAGKKVDLVILRNGVKLNKVVTRGVIPLQSVAASYMINSTTGFIKIESFSLATTNEFIAASYKLKKQGMKKLVIDLRGNPGGILQSATKIADEFFDAGVTLLITKGKEVGRTEYKSTKIGGLKDIEVTVLINSQSASASEILAGAIQDNDRGTVIGRRSFGKGLVQEDVELRDGSNLRITIARYYTPSGRCIQKPYNGNMDDYRNEQYDRYDNGEMYEVDSSYMVDSLKFTTPKGKVVYGGGGIQPDVFVPIDSTGSSWYFTAIRMTPAFTTYSFDYVENRRTKWSSAEDFNENFEVTDQILEDFVQFASSEYNVGIDRKELKHSKKGIKLLLKAQIARQMWIEQGYFIVFNSADPEVQEAVKYLNK